MRKFILSALLFLPFACAYAQPAIEWKKAYGGALSDGIGAGGAYNWSDIKQTSDGGYIFIGSSSSTDGDVTGSKGGGDMWVVKTNSTGTIQWQKCYGGTKSDIGTSIMQTTDGGYIGAGYTNSNDGDVTGFKGQNDVWVFKTDAMGVITWQKCLGGTDFDEHTQSIRQTPDGGYVFTCITYSEDGDISGKLATSSIDQWVCKISSTGTVDWQKAIGGNGVEGKGSVEPTPDGGYIVAGGNASSTGDVISKYTGGDASLVKFSSTGTIQWKKCYGGSKFDHFTMAIPAIGGGYIAVGSTLSNDNDVTKLHDSTEVLVVKTDDTGKVEWTKTYGGSKLDEGFSITVSNEGYYIVGGTTQSNDGDVNGLHMHGNLADNLLLGIYPNGTLKWSKVLGTDKQDRITVVSKTTDNGFVMFGNLLDGTGDGAGCGYHASSDLWVVKFGSTLDVETISAKNNIKVYPNPATDVINVELASVNDHTQLKLTDINGKLLRTVDAKSDKFTFDITDFPAGIYLLEYNDGENKQVMKLTKL